MIRWPGWYDDGPGPVNHHDVVYRPTMALGIALDIGIVILLIVAGIKGWWRTWLDALFAGVSGVACLGAIVAFFLATSLALFLGWFVVAWLARVLLGV